MFWVTLEAIPVLPPYSHYTVILYCTETRFCFCKAPPLKSGERGGHEAEEAEEQRKESGNYDGSGDKGDHDAADIIVYCICFIVFLFPVAIDACAVSSGVAGPDVGTVSKRISSAMGLVALLES